MHRFLGRLVVLTLNVHAIDFCVSIILAIFRNLIPF